MEINFPFDLLALKVPPRSIFQFIPQHNGEKIFLINEQISFCIYEGKKNLWFNIELTKQLLHKAT